MKEAGSGRLFPVISNLAARFSLYYNTLLLVDQSIEAQSLQEETIIAFYNERAGALNLKPWPIEQKSKLGHYH